LTKVIEIFLKVFYSTLIANLEQMTFKLVWVQ